MHTATMHTATIIPQPYRWIYESTARYSPVTSYMKANAYARFLMATGVELIDAAQQADARYFGSAGMDVNTYRRFLAYLATEG